jgi:hypothetical protein
MRKLRRVVLSKQGRLRRWGVNCSGEKKCIRCDAAIVGASSHVSAGTDTTANSLQGTYDSDPVLLNLRVTDAGHDGDEPATYQKMHNDQL